MRSTFERIIRSGSYNLEQMIRRINYYHAEGRLTDEDREALISLARGEAPNALELDGKAEILALWREIHTLQARVTALEDGGEEPSGTLVDGSADYPDYVQPTGAHDAYQAGQGVDGPQGRHDPVRIDPDLDVNRFFHAVLPPPAVAEADG